MAIMVKPYQNRGLQGEKRKLYPALYPVKQYPGHFQTEPSKRQSRFPRLLTKFMAGIRWLLPTWRKLSVSILQTTGGSNSSCARLTSTDWCQAAVKRQL